MPDYKILLSENTDKISKLHPSIRLQTQLFLETVQSELSIYLYITHGLRTFDEQELVYQKGRLLPGKISSNAKPGQSYHNYGLAFDVVPVEYIGRGNEYTDWKKLGEIGVSIGLEWGGNFKSIYDRRHFQNAFNFTHDQLLDLYLDNNLINGYVNLSPLKNDKIPKLSQTHK